MSAPIVEYTFDGPRLHPDALSFARHCLTVNGAGAATSLHDVTEIVARLLALLVAEGQLTVPQLASILGAELYT